MLTKKSKIKKFLFYFNKKSFFIKKVITENNQSSINEYIHNKTVIKKIKSFFILIVYASVKPKAVMIPIIHTHIADKAMNSCNI